MTGIQVNPLRRGRDIQHPRIPGEEQRLTIPGCARGDVRILQQHCQRVLQRAARPTEQAPPGYGRHAVQKQPEQPHGHPHGQGAKLHQMHQAQ